MKKTSYSTVFRLNTLSAMVGLALSSGYVRDAYADCEEVVDNNRVEVVCSDSMTLTDTVGTGPNSTIDGFTAAPDARITIEDKIAVSLGDSASVTISDGAGLMNYRLTTGGVVAMELAAAPWKSEVTVGSMSASAPISIQ